MVVVAAQAVVVVAAQAVVVAAQAVVVVAAQAVVVAAQALGWPEGPAPFGCHNSGRPPVLPDTPLGTQCWCRKRRRGI